MMWLVSEVKIPVQELEGQRGNRFPCTVNITDTVMRVVCNQEVNSL